MAHLLPNVNLRNVKYVSSYFYLYLISKKCLFIHASYSSLPAPELLKYLFIPLRRITLFVEKICKLAGKFAF